DAGTTPFRGEKGSAFEGGWRVPGIMWWPGHIAAGARYDEMMSHIDCWATLAGMVGITPPPHDWVGNDGKGIYFDSIDNSAYILAKAPHSARDSWIYIDGETFQGMRKDIDLPGNAKRHRRRSQGAVGAYSLEVSLYRQGLLARLGSKLGGDRRYVQPH